MTNAKCKPTVPANAPFVYKMNFKQSELEKVELIEYIDDRKIKKKVPIFDGTKGVEALLVLEEQFLKVCDQLQFDNAERFDQFEECLADGAEEHWLNVRGNHPRTNQGFTDALRAFYLHYTTSDGRDIMKQVMEHHCRKPLEVDCREHQNRFETMVRRSNKLQGYGSPIDAFDTKQWYFLSYPEGWQNDWNTGGNLVRDPTVTLNMITEYMENRKSYYDAKKKAKPRDGPKKDSEEERKRKRKEALRKKNQHDRDPKRHRDRYDDEGRVLCRKHNGAHAWIDCPDNRNGRAYRGGRGGGRNGGRGNGRFHNNNQRGNGSYNNNGSNNNGGSQYNGGTGNEQFHMQGQHSQGHVEEDVLHQSHGSAGCRK